MSKQRGVVHLSGQFDDMQLSIDGKRGTAKISVPVSKQRVATADEFENTRKVNVEFQAAAMAADTLQECLRGRNTSFGERYLRARMQAALIEAVRRGPGIFGQRSLEVVPNVLKLHQFALDEDERFKNRFKVQYDVQLNPDRNTVTVVVPPFDIDYGTMKVPRKSTHFRTFLCIGVMSDLEYSSSDNRYEAVNPDLNGMNAEFRTGWLSTVGQNPGFQMVASLAGLPILPATAGLVVSLGIEFCNMVNSFPVLRAEGNAMDIVDVF